MNSVGPCWHIVGVYPKLGRVRVFYYLWFCWDYVCEACCRRSGTDQPSETLYLNVPGIPVLVLFGLSVIDANKWLYRSKTGFDFVSELV